jgi:hypothetical protein
MESYFQPFYQGRLDPIDIPSTLQLPEVPVQKPQRKKQYNIKYCCPYHKHDPRTHISHSCSSGRTWRHLCEHLERIHGKYFCTKCCEHFRYLFEKEDHKNDTHHCQKCGKCFSSQHFCLKHYFPCRSNDDKWQQVYARLFDNSIRHNPRYVAIMRPRANGLNHFAPQNRDSAVEYDSWNINNGHQLIPMSSSDLQSNLGFRVGGIIDPNRQDVYGNQIFSPP